ncbi:Rrf2 family transcriptional regulator [Acidovorax sp. ACV01]|uniref:RrF2 family transcriptional regulator n=1 Tax=Acidovorax sp. ACV01 TaxID=2769311 RepID=UPI00177B65FC|nr:Rrf2 family transcriptional regulator [Acidovorax sp. ACV01]MBD9394207.1 Rrf2 family transcriptional regulator [Acidovorax sp. ACV01]
MRLTQWTDYTLRVLMYCAATEGREQPVTITEVAEGYGISRSHLMKIVQQLSAQGLLETTRGRGGGMRLMLPASAINIGAVVRATETDFNLVECFDPATNQCRLSSHCRLKGVLWQAMQAYLAVLDGVTLEDLMAPPAGPASAGGGAVRALLPTVALPRNGATPRRRLPVAGLPSAASEIE